MSRLYTVPFNAVAVTVAQDLLEIVSPADAVTRLHHVVIAQSSDTDSEQLLLAIIRGATTSGSGGSTVTPPPLSFGDPAYGGTCEANNTTRATAGTPVTLIADSFNVLNGWQWPSHPLAGPIDISPSQRLVIGLETAPADSLTMSGYAIIEEIGG